MAQTFTHNLLHPRHWLVWFGPTVASRSTSLPGFTYSGLWPWKNIQTLSETTGRNCD